MPGHILSAKCTCGFERELSPGASVDDLYLIAYTADDLVTIESENAKTAGLTVTEDPWLKAQEADSFALPRFDSSWGPYRCPRCAENWLWLWPIGHWD